MGGLHTRFLKYVRACKNRTQRADMLLDTAIIEHVGTRQRKGFEKKRHTDSGIQQSIQNPKRLVWPKLFVLWHV